MSFGRTSNSLSNKEDILNKHFLLTCLCKKKAKRSFLYYLKKNQSLPPKKKIKVKKTLKRQEKKRWWLKTFLSNFLLHYVCTSNMWHWINRHIRHDVFLCIVNKVKKKMRATPTCSGFYFTCMALYWNFNFLRMF